MIVSLFSGITPVFAAETEAGISWMCVGDSITYGNKVPGGYRAPLYDLFKQDGINLRMVGPNIKNNGEGLLPDGSGHAGYGGYYISEISQRIIPWLVSYRPQVVSLQIGSNDMLQNNIKNLPDDTRDGAPDRLSALIDKITQTLPETEVFVAKIPPFDSAGNNPHAVKYNAAVETVVNSKGGKVHLVDNYTALNDDVTANLQSDGIHPTLTGYQKMARSWYESSRSIVSALTPTEPQALMATSKTGKFLLQMNASGEAKYKNAASGDITLEPNTDYDVSFYAKGESGTTVLARIVTSDWGTILKNPSFGVGPGWAEYSFRFNSGDQKKVKLAFMDDSPVPGKVYIDDCAMVKAGTVDNMVKNPGFENLVSGWTLSSAFQVIQSVDVLTPPDNGDSGDKKVARTLSIAMDEFNDKNLPKDIYCASLTTGFYTAPDKRTANFVEAGSETGRGGIFYRDASDKGYLMINPKDGGQTAKFWMNKDNYNDITGFDEMRVRFKTMRHTDRPASDYEGDWSIEKKGSLKLGLSRATVGGEGVVAANNVFIKPEGFKTLDDNLWEECVFKRSDFAGGALDMEGDLKMYTEKDGKQHVLQITFGGPPSRYAWLIDEINFVWYDNEPTAQITELNFTNSGENINAYGLKTGENILTAALYNPTLAELKNAQFILALYNKKTGTFEKIENEEFGLAGKGNTEISLSVCIPSDADPTNYEARILMFKDFIGLKPILSEIYRFDGNGEVKSERSGGK